MGGSKENSKSDINRVKYFMAVMKYSRECLEDAFYLLYTAWARGKNYATLQEFCVECLGLRKEQLSEILCQPEIVPPQGSARNSTTLPSGVNGGAAGKASKESRASSGASHSPLFPSPSFSHVIRRSVRRNRSKSMNVQQGVTDTVGPVRKLSHGAEQNHRGHAIFYLGEGMSHNRISEASCGGDAGVSTDAPRQQDKESEVPKVASSSHLWSLAKRLLSPKPSVKKITDSNVSLGQGIVDHTVPTLPPSPPASPPARRGTVTGREVQTQQQMVNEDLKCVERGNSQNIISVIREAKYKLKSSFFLNDSSHENCFLNAEPDPSQMPLSVLVTLLTKVFPEVTPSKIHQLINQLQHLVYAVCYQDLVFDDHQLKFRLQNISVVISKLIATVISNCSAVTQKFIAEVSEKLRASKQQLRSAQAEYRNHLEWVEKTREDFEVVQKELKEAQARNSRVLLAYSRSCSQESNDTHKAAITRERKESCHSLAKGDTCVEGDIIGRMDSGNLSLCEELEGREARVERKDDEDNDWYSDSLLVSVMREVAVIEKRHNSLRPFDRRLKMMVRDSHKSVILTKREMRERLNSNVSAEENAMSKEEIVSRRQWKTRMLSKEVRKLRRNLKDLQSDEKVIMSRINHDLEALREDELVEAALREGRRGVQQLREGSGRLLWESRQEAKRFASRARIPDLGEWLMKQLYATSPVRQVYSRVRAADTRDSVHITDLLGPDGQPPVIVLSGPKGSGKTCMAHYLLQQWESNIEAIKSSIHEFDLVVYGTVDNILSSGSWAQYLREHIFCLTLVDFLEAEIFEALSTMSVLYLLDVDTAMPSVTKILDDVFHNVGNNQVLVTTRPDGEDDIVEAARRHSIKCQQVRMCPMTSSAIEEYSTSLLSLVEQDDSVISNNVKQFLRFVSSMKTTDEVLYPLPMTYVLYLWRINPRHALQATTVSRLISQVIVVAESSLVEALKASGRNDSRAALVRAEQCTKQLCEAAWQLISGHGWPHDSQFLLKSENMSLTDPIETASFSTLIIVKESTDGKQRASFLHPCIAETLCGFFLTQQRLLYKGSSMLRRREKLEKYCVPEIRRYKEILPHAAGALVYNKHKLEDAKEIAALFFGSLSNKSDMIAWHAFLKECDFLSTMCAAVSSVLSCYGSWTVAHHSQETNCALAELLKREAYHPQTIIISQEGKFCCNSQCVIRALATCSSTLVHLRQESQFYAWGEPATSDSLIVPLQPPGTLQEFWGHLGVEGALALRHFRHLIEVNVRISSCEALASLAYSIEHIGRSLRYLYLRLDLPTSTPVSDIEPLNFKGRNLWLRVKGVDDGSLSWLKEVTGKLSDWYTEVLLEKSRLSPSALHELKQTLPNTLVHMSS